MTTYRKIHGRSIQAVTTDPTESVAEGQIWYNTNSDTFKSVVSLEAWSSGAPTTEDKPNLASGAGTQTAGLIAGGNTPASTITNEYNGTSHSVGGALNNGGFGRNMGGTQTAGFCYGNQVSSPDFPTAECEHYNGTAWTTITNVPQVTSFGGSFGSTTAGVVFSGRINNNDDCNTVTSEYDGSSWTSGGAFPAAMRGIGSATGAPATDGISMGGQVQPGGTKQTTVNKYDGTSWTAETGIPTATSFASGSGANSDDALMFGGNAPSVTGNTFGYNGTSWTAKPSMATGRQAIGGAGTTTAAVAMAGNSPGSDNLTEEFNISTNVITAAAWSSSTAINTARNSFGGFGLQTANIIAGGYGSPNVKNETEEWDGTSWTEKNNLNTARSHYGGSQASPYTAAVIFKGNTSASDTSTNATEEWDGTNWTTVTANPTTGQRNMGAGTQTAALSFGGVQNPAPPAPRVATSQEYDGTNWSSGGTMNTARNDGGGTGTQTAAVGYGGDEPGASVATEEYNGSSWTSVNNMVIASGYYGQCGQSQTDAMAVGNLYASPDNGCQHYDGTTWSTRPLLGTARFDSAGSGTGTAAMVAGGGTPSNTDAVEEFTGETTAINVKTLTQS